LTFACNIHEAMALVDEGIREQANQTRFERGDRVFLGSHVDYDGSCRMWCGTFLSDNRRSQEKQNKRKVAMHINPFVSCEPVLVER
jgi:hypothetical protein